MKPLLPPIPLLLLLSLLSPTPLQATAHTLSSPNPAPASDPLRTSYPLGNGRLGLLPFGPAGAETLTLNIDSLWSGGPFQSADYTGGNPPAPVSDALPGIREWIFANGTGNVSALLGEGQAYGSYRVAGNISVVLGGGGDGIGTRVGAAEGTYERVLDLDTGVHSVRWAAGDGTWFRSDVACSYPDDVCVYALRSGAPLPDVTVRLGNALVGEELQEISCDESLGEVRMRGVTQLGPPEGMRYDVGVRAAGATGARCEDGALVISGRSGGNTSRPADDDNGAGDWQHSLSLVIAGGTNYDITAGTAASNYSFRGADPSDLVSRTLASASSQAPHALLQTAADDHSSHTTLFTLTLPDTALSANLSTPAAMARYSASGPGDPHLEATLFALARHLFVSSSRPGSLPPNLQGRWATGLENAWSADYHANINIQMNHWGVEETGLGGLAAPLWEYMARTWAPRGAETAGLLYGLDGGAGAWVVHNEMNVFGHTGMKDEAGWANYPAAAAWMMQHVYDRWSWGRDVQWVRETGFPLLRGVAEFWLGMLVEDGFFDDGSLVVAGCNSPEHGPTTFGCVHDQQLIHQVFEGAREMAAAVGGEDDFVGRVEQALGRLDLGLHFSDFGTLKEWKLPDSYGYDFPNDTHRHLSHLIGWYPGWSIAGYQEGLSNDTIRHAVKASLENRGMGIGPDANAGWAKVWRGACWARLGNAEKAYEELKFAIDENFVENGLSMYSGQSEPFQIDANFGLLGHMLAMLVTDLPLNPGAEQLPPVILGTAIPKAWSPGSVQGLKIRGGGTLDFSWNSDGVVDSAKSMGESISRRIMNKEGQQLSI